MATDPLFSARYSIAHARRNLGNLEVEIAAWGKSDVAAYVIEPNADGSQDVHKFKLVKPMPVALNGIAHDAVNALRSALDQAGFAIAVAAGAKGKNAHFPFGLTRQDVEGKIKGRSKDLPRELFDMMVACEPYKGGNDLLWSLNQLCNSHKHELVTPIGTALTNSIRGLSFGPLHLSWPVTLDWDTLKNEMELFSCPRGTKQNVKVRLRMFVAFADGTPVARKPVTAIISELCDVVDRIVMALETEARRVGLFK